MHEANRPDHGIEFVEDEAKLRDMLLDEGLLDRRTRAGLVLYLDVEAFGLAVAADPLEVGSPSETGVGLLEQEVQILGKAAVIRWV